MSRAVRLVCETCRAPFDRDASDSINHGEKELRALWRTREQVRALAESGAWDGFHDVRTAATYSSGDFFAWIAAHALHPVHLVDEYGGVAPVDDAGPCERCNCTVMDATEGEGGMGDPRKCPKHGRPGLAD